MNLARSILGPQALVRHGARPAILCEERVLTYAELGQETQRWARRLGELGVTKEDRVLIMLRDSPEMVAVWFGTIAAGGVAVALSTRLVGEDFAHVVRESAATVLVTEPLFEAECRSAVGIAGTGCHLYVIHENENESYPAEHLDPIWVEATERDQAFWIYSSGSTNRPKAIIHTHKDPVALTHYHRAGLGLKAGDIFYGTSKLFFAYTLSNVMLAGLTMGATLVLDREWPTVERVAALVARHKPKVFFSTTSLYRGLAASLGDGLREIFASTAHCVSAGEHMPKYLTERWIKHSGRPLWNGYGCSETLLLMLATSPDTVAPGTTGRPTPCVEVRLVGPDGKTITEPGRAGVLWARLPFLAVGYDKLPAETARRFRDGWFVTGDLFELDTDGLWCYRGREDDLIKVAGQWVRLGEVEEVASSIAGLRDAAVVAVPDENGAQRAALFVVPGGERNFDAIEPSVRQALETQLSRYKVPRWIIPLDAMPRTATGKIARGSLRKMAVEALSTAGASTGRL